MKKNVEMSNALVNLPDNSGGYTTQKTYFLYFYQDTRITFYAGVILLFKFDFFVVETMV